MICTRTQFDVIVVGAGLAGCSAALAAGERGLAVLLLEKMPDAGGSSALSAGGMAFAGIPAQSAAGIEDSAELLRRDLDRLGEGFGEPALIDAYLEHQAATQAWLSGHGVKFSTLTVGSGNSVPRVLRTDARRLIETLLAAIDKTGRVTRLMGVRALRLLQDAPQGKVCGLRIGAGAEEQDIAAGAVILATGGFSRDSALVRQFAPRMLEAVSIGGEGSTGDGLRMACGVGAGLRDMGFIRATFGSHPDSTGAHNTMMHPIYKGAIIVGRHARRFVNESLSYKDLGDACLAQPQAIGYQIFDSVVMARADRMAPTYDFESALAQGRLLQAASLKELAALLDIDADTLLATVADYNDIVAGRKTDPHGRKTLPGGGPLLPVDTGPFYAYPSKAALLSTYCGIAIDARARVLDTFGHPIEGLFAAGELTGGFHGAGYLSGTSLSKSAIMGRIAGQQAAARCDGDAPGPAAS